MLAQYPPFPEVIFCLNLIMGESGCSGCKIGLDWSRSFHVFSVEIPLNQNCEPKIEIRANNLRFLSIGVSGGSDGPATPGAPGSRRIKATGRGSLGPSSCDLGTVFETNELYQLRSGRSGSLLFAVQTCRTGKRLINSKLLEEQGDTSKLTPYPEFPIQTKFYL